MARYLFYVDPEEVSLKCIHQPERTVDYFQQLEASGASKSTTLNYMDSVQKFARHVTSEPKCLEDPSLKPAASRFFDLLNDIRLKINKKAAKGTKEMG